MSLCCKYVNGDGKGFGPHKWGFSCALLKDHSGDHSPYPETERQGVLPSDQNRTTEKKISELRKRLAELEHKNNKHKQDCLVKCLGWTINSRQNGCGALLPIRDLEYIQTHWYTPPSGCIEGDYWNQGEGQFICPNCGETNRLYERPEVEALKNSFKNVKDTYER